MNSQHKIRRKEIVPFGVMVERFVARFTIVGLLLMMVCPFTLVNAQEDTLCADETVVVVSEPTEVLETTSEVSVRCNNENTIDIRLNESFTQSAILASVEDLSSDEILDIKYDLGILEKPIEYRYQITDEEYSILCRVVEAEVEGYDVWKARGLSHSQIIESKCRVAQVFLNRLENKKRFKHKNLKSALLYPNATSTINNGSYYRTTVTEYTREAVNLALLASTPDFTGGAYFFTSGSVNPHGKYLFTDPVGHKFGR